MVSRDFVLKIIFNVMKNVLAICHFLVYIICDLSFLLLVNERQKWE